MKKTMLIATGLSACLAFAVTPLPAQEKPVVAAGGHSHFTKIPATVAEIWTEIHKQEVKLAQVVAAKDLGEAHDHAFAIRDLVKALPEKVPAAAKSAAEKGAKEIIGLAAAIDKSGAARAQKATEENVKKLGAALKALEARLKLVEGRK